MTTYYVSPLGNDSNSGTQSQPFATIQKGISASSNGDTIQVLSGTYYLTSYINLNKSISIIGAGRGNSIVDGLNVTNYGSTDGLVWITADNVLFQGFTVQNAITPSQSTGAAGIAIRSSNNIVEKNLIYQTYDSGIMLWGSSLSSIARNNTVRYNELSSIVWGGNVSSTRQEALSIQDADLFYIYYNYVHDAGNSPTGNLVGGEGIDAKNGINTLGGNGYIHHNYVLRANYTGIYADGYNDGCSNIEVYNNIVENTTEGGSGLANHGDGIDANTEVSGPTNQINIHDNIVYNTHNGYTICNYHHSGASPGLISNITMNNNIAYIDDPSIPASDRYDMNIQNCGNNMSNLLVTNNYANTMYIDSSGIMPNGQTIASILTLSGNNQNLTDITNQFNTKYSTLKIDILNHVLGECISPTCDFNIT